MYVFIGLEVRLLSDKYLIVRTLFCAPVIIISPLPSSIQRFASEKEGDREVQRTMLELLNQLDGFSSHSDIKVSKPGGLFNIANYVFLFCLHFNIVYLR